MRFNGKYQSPSSILWKDCINCINEYMACDRLDSLLKTILEIIKKNHREFEACADPDFLEFVLCMDADDYMVGTNGDDYKLILGTYCKQKEPTTVEIWHILAQLTWDLTVPVTDKICPFCGCDNTILLTDKNKAIYESCENCFRTRNKGNEIERPDNLIPAKKEMVMKNKYHVLHE